MTATTTHPLRTGAIWNLRPRSHPSTWPAEHPLGHLPDRPPEQPADHRPARRGRAPGPELHQLRLALDVQVEAMLLALSATARDDSGLVPWRRWLLEDLDTVRWLTGALVAADADPSPALGGASFDAGSARDLLDTMVAEYTSMNELLCSALAHLDGGESWRRVAVQVRRRCRSRLEELHAERTAAVQRAAIAHDLDCEADAAMAFGGSVPGEMLG